MEDNATPLMVTIRCITYNHEPYIRQCLEGFVMQKTNFRFEAIVHDDASIDGTAAIIREYAEKYPDIIKPIIETENQYSKHNGSIGRILNAHTHGKYVAMCEGDDYWTNPLKLQKQVDFLETNPEYGLVYTDVNFYFQEKDRMIEGCISSGQLKRSYSFEEHLENAGYIAPCTWLYRKQYLPAGQSSYVDGTFPLALDIWAQSKIYYLDEVTAVYRHLSESASHSRLLKRNFHFANGVFQIQKDYIKKYFDIISESTKERIYVNAYNRLLPAAIALSNASFVTEAQSFLNNRKGTYKIKFLLFLYQIIPLHIILRILYKLKGKIV